MGENGHRKCVLVLVFTQSPEERYAVQAHQHGFQRAELVYLHTIWCDVEKVQGTCAGSACPLGPFCLHPLHSLSRQLLDEKRFSLGAYQELVFFLLEVCLYISLSW